MNLGLKRWFKGKKGEISHENFTCRNCGTIFNGQFCPECGQSVKDYDKPFSFIIYNFAGDFFSFDTRFFRTFIALIIKPGFLSLEYFKGKRIKYAPPFRLFIFASFILFLLLQTYTNRGLTTVLDSSLSDKIIVGSDSDNFTTADSILREENVTPDIAGKVAKDSLFKELDVVLDSLEVNDATFKINLETFRDTRNLRQGLNKLALVLEEKLKTESDPEEQRMLKENIRLCRSPEQAVAKILQYMSWAFFLLLPIFAFILKLVYVRRKHNYMRHLIFSIHIHSFIFFVFTLIAGTYLLININLELFTILLFFSIPVYLIIAMKKFYGQSVGKVIAKFFSISILYNIIFWFIVIFVFINALNIV